MKNLISLLSALIVGLTMPPPALATEAGAAVPAAALALSEGMVKRVDLATGRIALAHGPIENLGMPPMTMTFEVTDKALLKGIKAGDKVRFRAEQIRDRLIVTSLKLAR